MPASIARIGPLRSTSYSILAYVLSYPHCIGLMVDSYIIVIQGEVGRICIYEIAYLNFFDG